MVNEADFAIITDEIWILCEKLNRITSYMVQISTLNDMMLQKEAYQ